MKGQDRAVVSTSESGLLDVYLVAVDHHAYCSSSGGGFFDSAKVHDSETTVGHWMNLGGCRITWKDLKNTFMDEHVIQVCRTSRCDHALFKSNSSITTQAPQ